MLVGFVRLMEGSSAACEDWSRFHGVLRCFLVSRSEALKLEEGTAIFGCCGSRLRLGEVYVAPQADGKVPVYFWRLGDGAEGF